MIEIFDQNTWEFMIIGPFIGAILGVLLWIITLLVLYTIIYYSWIYINDGDLGEMHRYLYNFDYFCGLLVCQIYLILCVTTPFILIAQQYYPWLLLFLGICYAVLYLSRAVFRLHKLTKKHVDNREIHRY